MKLLLLRLARSAGAGGVASLADLATLTLLVSVFGVTPRAASVPALLVGNVVMFFGQRLAFRAAGGDVRRQLAWFALVQLGGFGLNALAYDAAVRTWPLAERWFVVTRIVTTNVVWIAYSFPLWHVVFRASKRATP